MKKANAASLASREVGKTDTQPGAGGIVRYTEAEWRDEGARRFGPDLLTWRFVCPICGNVATPGDFKPFAHLGSTPQSAASECIGRYTGAKDSVNRSQPCNYAGYGLFRLSPARVLFSDGKECHSFGFAEPAALPESTTAAEQYEQTKTVHGGRTK